MIIIIICICKVFKTFVTFTKLELMGKMAYFGWCNEQMLWRHLTKQRKTQDFLCLSLTDDGGAGMVQHPI
jgi:hypothetical protein